ncbi:hypothetical protein OG897_07760 [Streptomyces sp. NBC_00237]|uniref:hypothetical protein n=1 Tax=Streptomyces sp. NBC_00237 TaxID=2975687 RepID=UPI002254716E|nr:hypothetical protein [Streptomyces sp. NBC_00237]MCX5201349.1 hypothetical protein [Streptomyces sp. NBC_00237]
MPRSTARPRSARPTTGAALAALAVAGLALGTGGVARADVPEPVEDVVSSTVQDVPSVQDPLSDAGALPDADVPWPEADAVAAADAPLPGHLSITPEHIAPGTTVVVHTTACGPDDKGTGNASSLGVGDFALGGGDSQQALAGEFTVPAATTPGTYGISVSCADGKRSARGDVVVRAASDTATIPSATPSHTPSHTPSAPHPTPTTPTGHVRTGVGGSVSALDTPQIAAGSAILAASAVGGTWLLRRRASGSR